jgi:C4-dicarboxylate transporter
VTSSSELVKTLIYLYYALVPFLPFISFTIAKNYEFGEGEITVLILINTIAIILYGKMICNECCESGGDCE